jgi:hypothetical protein
MEMKTTIAAALLLALAPALRAEEQKAPPPPKIDDAKVDAAIKKGVRYLRDHAATHHGLPPSTKELALLALVHAGVKPGDSWVDELLRAVLEEDLRTTYRTALQARLLEELDRAAYQKRIFQCAQFLVDNQCQNGQWAYGEPTTYPDPRPAPDITDDDAAPGRPPLKTKYLVRKQRDGPDRGDNSNSQIAILGLRACHDAGIVLPKEVVAKAAQWWKDSQGVTKGWSYGPKGNRPYGSMTAGGVAALTICDYLLGSDWKKDEALSGALGWLRDNFSITENPGRSGPHHYYYLYALERAGRLYGFDQLGKWDWYAEGAAYLLANQADDGSWNKKPVDTCFAILFLRRATRPLVASVDKQ